MTKRAVFLALAAYMAAGGHAGEPPAAHQPIVPPLPAKEWERLLRGLGTLMTPEQARQWESKLAIERRSLGVRFSAKQRRAMLAEVKHDDAVAIRQAKGIDARSLRMDDWEVSASFRYQASQRFRVKYRLSDLEFEVLGNEESLLSRMNRK